MISIREFAQNHGCTVQNIYKHIKANQKDLEEHIHKRGSKKFLDEYAQEYLETLITPKNIILQADEELMKQLNQARAKIAEMSQTIAALSTESADKSKKIAEFEKNQSLLENKYQNSEKEKDEYKEKYEEFKEEAESYKKFAFNLYIKKNRA